MVAVNVLVAVAEAEAGNFPTIVEAVAMIVPSVVRLFNLGKWPPKFGGFGRRMRGKMRPQSWIFFLQIGLTESMLSGAEKNREIIPLTWRNSWKVAIRGLWSENELEKLLQM